MLQAPSAFFLENGGKAMLIASGYKAEPSLAALFANVWPTWPRKDGSISAALTRPGTAPVPATLAVWPGGLALHSPAKLTAPDERVTVDRGLAGAAIFKFAWSLLNKPRPLLFVTAGASYGSAVTDSRLTLDPSLVEGGGHIGFTLDKERVELVIQFAEHFRLTPLKLRTLKANLEFGLAYPRTLSSVVGRQNFRSPRHPAMIQQARRAVGLRPRGGGPSQEDHDRVAEYWRDVASLPSMDDPAWTVAEFLSKQEKAA